MKIIIVEDRCLEAYENTQANIGHGQSLHVGMHEVGRVRRSAGIFEGQLRVVAHQSVHTKSMAIYAIH